MAAPPSVTAGAQLSGDGDRDRPGPAEQSLGATALADPRVTLHLLKEEGAAGTGAGVWTRSTTTVPAPDSGLRSLSY
ncbi:hypothetical protein Q5P01_022909 [Channa striata]|uniref:Uncharacterized protein n=1 Tax=Channa striata TaxID=64152 RepID=A0AA88LRY4_CHASR|nr:hypothetical protein Q5P01_022909 [Channa striata]